MISVLISILVLALVFGLIWYAISLLPLPAPFGNIAKVVVIIIFILMLLSMIGVMPGIGLAPFVIR